MLNDPLDKAFEASPHASPDPTEKGFEEYLRQQGIEDSDDSEDPKDTEPVYTPTKKEHRTLQLEQVYREFDVDGNGHVGAKEMLLVGQARRTLGHKKNEWTEEQNNRMMANMSPDEYGNVFIGNFVSYFLNALPLDDEAFDNTIQQFLDCAKMLNEKKRKERQEVFTEAFTELRDSQAETWCQPESEAARIFDLADTSGDGNLAQKELLAFIKEEQGGELAKFFSRGGASMTKQKQRVHDFCEEVNKLNAKKKNKDGAFVVTKADFIEIYTKKIASQSTSP